MTQVALALALAAAVAAPHRVDLERAAPAAAAATWLLALTLRALLAVLAAALVVRYLPATDALAVISDWCLDFISPMFAGDFPISGHALGDATLLAPAVVLAASVAWAVWGTWRAARKVAGLLAGGSIGRGPDDSTVLADRTVLVGVAGLRRPRVVVSAGALLVFDDDELVASLAHERGHIRRGHRFVVLSATVLGAIARFVPGTRQAAAELLYHLERDADDYAVRRADPAALASAICKAAASRAPASPVALMLTGGPLQRRVVRLLDAPLPLAWRTRLATRALLSALAALVATAAYLVPPAVADGVAAVSAGAPAHQCYHPA